MKIISLNIGKHHQIYTTKNRMQTTGIYKIPTDSPVKLGELGFKGDFIAIFGRNGFGEFLRGLFLSGHPICSP